MKDFPRFVAIVLLLGTSGAGAGTAMNFGAPKANLLSALDRGATYHRYGGGESTGSSSSGSGAGAGVSVRQGSRGYYSGGSSSYSSWGGGGYSSRSHLGGGFSGGK